MIEKFILALGSFLWAKLEPRLNKLQDELTAEFKLQLAEMRKEIMIDWDETTDQLMKDLDESSDQIIDRLVPDLTVLSQKIVEGIRIPNIFGSKR